MSDQLASQNASLLIEVQSLRQEVAELKQLIMEGFKMNRDVSPQLSVDTPPQRAAEQPNPAHYCKVCDKVCTNMSKHKQTNAHRRKEEQQRQTQIQIATNVQIACCGNVNVNASFQPQVKQACSIYSEDAKNIEQIPVNYDLHDLTEKCSVVKDVQEYWKKQPQDLRPIFYHKGKWHVKADGTWYEGAEALDQLNKWAKAIHLKQKEAVHAYNESLDFKNMNSRQQDEYVSFVRNWNSGTERNGLYSRKDEIEHKSKLLHRMVDSLTWREDKCWSYDPLIS